MISTEELKKWKEKILENRTFAQENALANFQNEAISEYYIHAAQICEHQLSFVERLILQSIENDSKSEKAVC